VEATDGALITLIEPILNPLWVWLLVGEPTGRGTMLGGALLLAALVVRFLGARRAPVSASPASQAAPRPSSGSRSTECGA
jgi:hypothetical protein